MCSVSSADVEESVFGRRDEETVQLVHAAAVDVAAAACITRIMFRIQDDACVSHHHILFRSVCDECIVVARITHCVGFFFRCDVVCIL